jgi:hypothetical protein
MFTIFTDMNDKLMLVKCITLLFRESQLSGAQENSAQLVRNVLAEIREPQHSIGLEHDREVIRALRKTALSMCEAPADHEHETVEILQQLKVDCGEDDNLYASLVDGISADLGENRLRRTALNLRRAINEYFREEKIQQIINQAANKLRFNRTEVTSMKDFVSQVCTELEPYQIDAQEKDPAVVSEVDFSRVEEIKRIFREVKKAESGRSLMRTGWQAVNRMLRGGLRRGQEVVIPALQHRFKTGFSLAIFIGVALFNTPEMIDPARRPLLLRISFEDDLELNFQYMYEVLMAHDGREAEIITRRRQDFERMSEDELEAYIAPIATYVQDRLRVNGYEIRLMRVNPSDWTYRDLCNKILELEAEGYEVHLCMVDYLSMLPTTGCTMGPAGTDLLDLYRRIRNFCSIRKIAFVTPHQLSSDARQLYRDGTTDFVKHLPGMGYYKGSRQIDQEVDLEIFIHIEIANGESFLTVQRGKHRLIGQTSPRDLYCVLPFGRYGIPFDIDAPEITCRYPGSRPSSMTSDVSSGGAHGAADGPAAHRTEKPFWDFSMEGG